MSSCRLPIQYLQANSLAVPQIRTAPFQSFAIYYRMIIIYNNKYGMVDNTCNSRQQYVQAFCALDKQASLDTSPTYQIKSLTLHTI
jgi:hypothetical protein